MYLRVAFTLFAVAAISYTVFGLIYVTADQFMPYHAQALSVEWAHLDDNYRILFLGLIKMAGAGGLVAGVVSLSLLAYLCRRTSSILVWLLPVPALIFQSTTNFVVYSVYTNTPGEPPLLLVSIGSFLLILATLLLIIGVRGNRA